MSSHENINYESYEQNDLYEVKVLNTRFKLYKSLTSILEVT